MALLTISEVASRVGLRSSTIRYYEQIGLLPAAQRISGRRRYDSTVLYRLIVIRQARQTGFTLPEIKTLFYGFRSGTPPSVRWERLRKQKMIELDTMAGRIESMRRLLGRQGQCDCRALEECGKKILEQHCTTVPQKPAGRKSPPQSFTFPIGSGCQS